MNIKGMSNDLLKFPLSYGYSLVGIVTKCAPDVDDKDEILGRLVFSFSPHSSYIVQDRNQLQLIPEGISAEDAVFLPSIETALSIVHVAHLKAGENVAIFGQGLIGLLVSAIISSQKLPVCDMCDKFSKVTVFDTNINRLAVASSLGVSEALIPTSTALEKSGPFDVSVEVSGNFRALQYALDHTSRGGRVVIASWYGNSDVHLRLGMDFHRSELTIKTTQVSEIPAEMSKLWDKKRRFALSWELIRALMPSKLVSSSHTLDRAQDAYIALEEGKETAVIFKY